MANGAKQIYRFRKYYTFNFNSEPNDKVITHLLGYPIQTDDEKKVLRGTKISKRVPKTIENNETIIIESLLKRALPASVTNNTLCETISNIN